MKRIFAALLLVHAATAHADVLVDHVDGLSFDNNGNPVRFAALLINNDGRIAQVFRAGDKRPGKVDYAVDGKGAMVIPGIIAGPVNLMALALRSITRNPTDGPLPTPRPEDRDLALAKLQQSLLARGITGVADMGTTIEDWQSYRRAGDAGMLTIRIAAYAGGVAQMVLIGGPGPSPWLYQDRLRLNGLWLDPLGPPKMNDIQRKNSMSRAALDRFQAAVKVDATSITAVQADIAELGKTYAGDRRWRLECDDKKWEPVFVKKSHDNKELERTFDSIKCDHALESGLSATLPDPYTAMGTVLDRTGWLANRTTKAARDSFAEGRFGSIAVGERADFVMLDRDIMLASVAELRETKVLQTWVNGVMVYKVP